MPRAPAMPANATDADWRSYVRRLSGLWAADRIRLVGRWESVVSQRTETAECLDRERAAGRIR